MTNNLLQLTFTCSKSTTKTVTKGLKLNYCYIWMYFTPLSSYSIDLEHINVSRKATLLINLRST